MKGAEPITWEQCKAATEEMLGRLAPLSEEFITNLDRAKGIYMIAYAGAELGGSLWGASEPKVVFVGLCKPNSSRHFTSGTTGTSTIRRSLAAMLASKLDLVPIPRSADPGDNDRYDNYMLDTESEDKLTNWMRSNFTAAYLEVGDDKAEAMQRAMVEFSAPMFNFQFNPANKFGAEIKILRKKMAGEAKKNEIA